MKYKNTYLRGKGVVMIDQSRLEKGLYWQRAWKLVEGCTKVSPACDNCWSESETKMRCRHDNEKISGRAQAVAEDQSGNLVGFDGRIIVREDNLDLPLRTRKPTVFAVWNDLYHEDVPLSFICDAVQVMGRARKLGHVFLILTKRAERMGVFLDEVGIDVPDHIWHGVTVENQEQANVRIQHLLQVPGNIFVSQEPALGRVVYSVHQLARIGAILLGGESGKGARPMKPDWARSVRDQCAAAGVPFFFKQWGEWVSVSEVAGAGVHHHFQDGATVRRVGKQKAGRTLDGCLHDDIPWLTLSHARD